jgi:hypothetical protein
MFRYGYRPTEAIVTKGTLMRRLLTGASAFIALLIVLSGCSNNSGGGAPPTVDEATRQSALTQQGIATAPKGGGGEAARQAELTKQGVGGSATPSTPGR